MHSTSTARRSGLALLALAAALATTACGPTDATTTAPTTASTESAGTADAFAVRPEPSDNGPSDNGPSDNGPSGNGPSDSGPTAGGPTDRGPAPAPGPTDISPTYPDTAEAYAKAVVTAWTQDQPGSLATLTTAAVNDQILDLLPTVNDEWSFLRCDGTAGSSYCSFTNADGDLLTLRISHSLLAKAHAAIEVSLDKTEYPGDGVAYVKEFVGAWQFGNTARMLKLSSPTIVAQVNVAQVNAAPISPTYPTPTCCGGGLLQVTVKWSGTSARFDVGTIKLSGPHAIVGYAPGQLPITS